MKGQTRDGYKMVPMTVLTHIPYYFGAVTQVLLFLFAAVAKLAEVRELKFIHFAEWQVIRIPFQIHVFGRSWQYRRYYLLFNTNYNGDWANYIDSFSRIPKIRLGMDFVWGTGKHYPWASRETRFKQYIQDNEQIPDHYYSNYGSASIRDILNAQQVGKSSGEIDWSQANASQRFLAKNAARLVRVDLSKVSMPAVLNHKRKNVCLYSIVCPLNVVAFDLKSTELRQLFSKQTATLDELFCVPMLHVSRLDIIDNLGSRSPAGGARCSMRHPLLLWTFVLDSTVVDFIDALIKRNFTLMQAIFGECNGAPACELLDSKPLREFLLAQVQASGLQYVSSNSTVMETVSATQRLNDIVDSVYSSKKFTTPENTSS